MIYMCIYILMVQTRTHTFANGKETLREHPVGFLVVYLGDSFKFPCRMRKAGPGRMEEDDAVRPLCAPSPRSRWWSHTH